MSKYSNTVQDLDRCVLTLEVVVSGQHCQITAPIGTTATVVNLHGQYKALWKRRPVDITSRALTIHSYLVYLYLNISCSNTMNFGL